MPKRWRNRLYTGNSTNRYIFFSLSGKMIDNLYQTEEGDRHRALDGITMFLLPSPEKTKTLQKTIQKYNINYNENEKW